MNREEFLEYLVPSLPENSITIELGVFRGDFSESILKILKPEVLHLVDPFTVSLDKNSNRNYGDPVGGIPTAYSNEEDYRTILKRFALEISSSKVVVHRGFSYDSVQHFPNSYFDFIYIDACHHYECVKADLNNYLPKLKPSGLLCGHDYTVYADFGVIQATNEFCIENNFKFTILSDDNDWALQRI